MDSLMIALYRPIGLMTYSAVPGGLSVQVLSIRSPCPAVPSRATDRVDSGLLLSFIRHRHSMHLWKYP